MLTIKTNLHELTATVAALPEKHLLGTALIGTSQSVHQRDAIIAATLELIQYQNSAAVYVHRFDNLPAIAVLALEQLEYGL